MAAYSSILPPSSLGEVLRPLESLSDKDFEVILNAVAGPRSFSLTKEEIENLRNQTPPDAGRNLTFFVSALSFVYSHVARLTESKMPYADAIKDIVDEIAKDAEWTDKDKVVGRLEKLLNPKIHEPLHKAQRLQTGFLPNAVGFSTMVDLRPDFGIGSELQLSAYVPVIQFRINTDSIVPAERRIVFQITESNLAELKKAIDRAEEKIRMLRENSGVANLIIRQP